MERVISPEAEKLVERIRKAVDDMDAIGPTVWRRVTPERSAVMNQREQAEMLRFGELRDEFEELIEQLEEQWRSEGHSEEEIQWLRWNEVPRRAWLRK